MAPNRLDGVLATVTQWQNTLLHVEFSGSIPGRTGICKKNFPGARRDDGAESQSLISAPNVPVLKLKSLRSIRCEGICTVDSDSSVRWGR